MKWSKLLDAIRRNPEEREMEEQLDGGDADGAHLICMPWEKRLDQPPAVAEMACSDCGGSIAVSTHAIQRWKNLSPMCAACAVEKIDLNDEEAYMKIYENPMSSHSLSDHERETAMKFGNGLVKNSQVFDLIRKDKESWRANKRGGLKN